MVKTILARLQFRLVVSIAIITAVFLIMVHESFVNSTYALTRYYNCVTRVANNNGTLTLDNVQACYYKVFQGARDADGDGNKLE